MTQQARNLLMLLDDEDARPRFLVVTATASSPRPPLTELRPSDEQAMADVIDLDRIRRHDLLGGLIHEYEFAA